MLHFFLGPLPGDDLELRIVVEDAAEIGRIVAAVMLDHGGGLDHFENIGIDLGGIELRPGDIVEGPMPFARHGSLHGFCPPHAPIVGMPAAGRKTL